MSPDSGIEGRVVAALKPFGFTATDSRIYLALLRQHPATGYEVAASSGVPRSAIYATLKRLEGMGPDQQKQLKKLFSLEEEKRGAMMERFREMMDRDGRGRKDGARNEGKKDGA